jgi:hypothetical protein
MFGSGLITEAILDQRDRNAKRAANVRAVSKRQKMQDGAITLDESDYEWSDPLALSNQKGQ